MGKFERKQAKVANIIASPEMRAIQKVHFGLFQSLWLFAMTEKSVIASPKGEAIQKGYSGLFQSLQHLAMTVNVCICLFFLFFTTPFCYAATPTQSLEQLLDKTQTMQANFSQILKNEKGQLLQTSTGVVYIQKPNRFRWQIKTPNPQIIVADGKRLWIYDIDLEQVTLRTMAHGLEETPAALLSGHSGYLTENFIITKQDSWFKLIPKNPETSFQWIKLYFQNGILTQMKMLDKLGQESDLTFSNMQLNKAIAKKIFQFKPPQVVDVIQAD